jgi:hypothetical protein
MNRCVIPAGSSAMGINGHTDGSAFLSSFVFYILSCLDPPATFAGSVPTGLSSWIAGANEKVKHHSVVGNEMMLITLLVESLT